MTEYRQIEKIARVCVVSSNRFDTITLTLATLRYNFNIDATTEPSKKMWGMYFFACGI